MTAYPKKIVTLIGDSSVGFTNAKDNDIIQSQIAGLATASLNWMNYWNKRDTQVFLPCKKFHRTTKMTSRTMIMSPHAIGLSYFD